jgi:predicted DsbA family dithiol-disulfide isomerase
MKVEIWADVVCPWCYIGRKRFGKALGQYDGHASVEVVYRSFELDPGAPIDSDMTLDESLAAKYGLSPTEARTANERATKLAAAEGLEFHLERARPTNTLAAHRVLQLAAVRRIRPAVEERFLKGYFSEGASLANPEMLLRLSIEAGLKEPDVRRVLAGQAFTLQVRADEAEAAALGLEGVPFFLFDRTRTISGAQTTEFFQNVLEMVGARTGTGSGPPSEAYSPP